MKIRRNQTLAATSMAILGVILGFVSGCGQTSDQRSSDLKGQTAYEKCESQIEARYQKDIKNAVKNPEAAAVRIAYQNIDGNFPSYNYTCEPSGKKYSCSLEGVFTPRLSACTD